MVAVRYIIFGQITDDFQPNCSCDVLAEEHNETHCNSREADSTAKSLPSRAFRG